MKHLVLIAVLALPLTLHAQPGCADCAPANPSPNTPAVTPEPSSLVLLGTGLVSAAGMILRRKR